MWLDKLLYTNRIKYCPKCQVAVQQCNFGQYHCESCGFNQLDDYVKIRKYLSQNGPSMFSKSQKRMMWIRMLYIIVCEMEE